MVQIDTITFKEWPGEDGHNIVCISPRTEEETELETLSYSMRVIERNERLLVRICARTNLAALSN